MALLTIFSAPKPFTNLSAATIQRNAIRSWMEMGAEVEVILLGEEEGLSDVAKSLGVCHVGGIRRNSSGTPMVSSLFDAARNVSTSPLLAYVNADILLFQDFFDTSLRIFAENKRFLQVGQRWDLAIPSDLDFSGGWQEKLKRDCKSRGVLHKPRGSDYFIFPRPCFQDIPDFAIGRAGWDNWMIYKSRVEGWKTIDSTDGIFAIHQEHDYSHLPEGKSHYHLPETDENIRLAGGKRAIFMLGDATWVYQQGQLHRVRWSWRKFLREIEIFPLVSLKSMVLGEIIYYLFHPKNAYGLIRSWFGIWIKKRRP
ncbi:MAG: hypothetical protein NTZ74_11395 [Chloroflexi bacterium]|nr:hypothetical protein [Chloroflexota bacterium]